MEVLVEALVEASTSGGDPLVPAREALRRTFGFHAFRDGQERAIAAVLSGKDALVVMPTGSGKSLCYQVPALVLPGVTLVVSPLIALMKDQVDALLLRGVAATFINSSLGLDEQWERLREMERGAYRIVYIAPERFRSKAFQSALARLSVSLLAVDEAHCISQWGHDFRPDYRRLGAVREKLAGVPVLASTATATPDVQEDIARELAMSGHEMVLTGFDRPNLALRVEKARGEAAKKEKLEAFLRAAIERHANSDAEGLPPGIVYTGTRRHAEEVADFLSSAEWTRGVEPRACAAYHGGLDMEERRAIQEDFMEGRLPWVAATNAFGMGVDKSDVRFVVHWDMPGSIEAYYQEVGRGGRDGARAECLFLFNESGRRLQEFFIEGSNPTRPVIEAVQEFLHALGENPIFRSLVELERLFEGSVSHLTSNPLVFRSSVAILERAGALERLDHSQNLAEVAPCGLLPLADDIHSDRARLKRAVHEALALVFARTEGEPASISVERWARDLEMSEDSIRRTLSQLADEGLIRYVPPFRGSAILLPGVLEPPAVDHEVLAARRRRDLERLEKVIAYARSRSCRRNAVLAHFQAGGEEAQPAPGCGSCDRCAGRAEAGPRGPIGESGEIVVRKALSGVARARGRCGARRIAQMLRGSRTKLVAEMGLDRLSTFGVLRELAREEVAELLDLLEVEGCIRSWGDRKPVLRITPRGIRVMKGEERLEVQAPPAFLARPAGSRGVDGEYDRELFEALRSLRRRIAEELSVPAFRVFGDKTLRSMARAVPLDEAGLLEIHGVGQRTLERFGPRFLEVLRSHGR